MKEKYIFIALFCPFLFLSACGNTENTPAAAAPVNTTQISGQPAKSLNELQTRLVEALEKRDLNLLRPLLADTLTDGAADGGADCPGGCPVDTFLALKFADENTKGNFYNAFLRIAKAGFAPVQDNPNVYFAPAYSLKLRENELFIVGKNVNIREKPGTQAKIVSQKSYEKITYVPDENEMPQTAEKDDYYWVKIKLSGGKIGYVASKFTSMAYYQDIEATQKDGKFMITGFIDAFVCAL